MNALDDRIFLRPSNTEAEQRLASLGATLVDEDSTPGTHELAGYEAECRTRPEQCVTPLWLEHQSELSSWLPPELSPLYRPLRHPDGVPEMHTLVICLAGIRGEDRRHAQEMVKAVGAELSPELTGRTTHLVCAHGDAKDEERRVHKVRESLRRGSAVKRVKLAWLQLCVRAWARLDEEIFALQASELPQRPGRFAAAAGAARESLARSGSDEDSETDDSSFIASEGPSEDGEAGSDSSPDESDPDDAVPVGRRTGQSEERPPKRPPSQQSRTKQVKAARQPRPPANPRPGGPTADSSDEETTARKEAYIARVRGHGAETQDPGGPSEQPGDEPAVPSAEQEEPLEPGAPEEPTEMQAYAAAKGLSLYTAENNETPASVAKRERVSLEELLFHNAKFYRKPPIKSQSRLKADTKLVLPEPLEDQAAAAARAAQDAAEKALREGACVNIPAHPHPLTRAKSKDAKCDICGKYGAEFECTHNGEQGCDYDVCHACYLEAAAPVLIAEKHPHPLIRLWNEGYKCDLCISGVCSAPRAGVGCTVLQCMHAGVCASCDFDVCQECYDSAAGLVVGLGAGLGLQADLGAGAQQEAAAAGASTPQTAMEVEEEVASVEAEPGAGMEPEVRQEEQEAAHAGRADEAAEDAMMAEPDECELGDHREADEAQQRPSVGDAQEERPDAQEQPFFAEASASEPVALVAGAGQAAESTLTPAKAKPDEGELEASPELESGQPSQRGESLPSQGAASCQSGVANYGVEEDEREMAAAASSEQPAAVDEGHAVQPASPAMHAQAAAEAHVPEPGESGAAETQGAAEVQSVQATPQAGAAEVQSVQATPQAGAAEVQSVQAMLQAGAAEVQSVQATPQAGHVPPRPRVVQATAENTPEGRELRATVEALGGEFASGQTGEFDSRCTHLVLLQTKRSEKLLAALAAGCWLLRPGWAEASKAAGAWAPEAEWELFEAGDASLPLGKGSLWLGAARRHRLRRQDGRAACFAGLVFVIDPDTRPGPETLERIVRAGGGLVVPSASDAGVDAAIVPEGASLRRGLSRDADELGIPRVTTSFIFEVLLEQYPRSLAQAQL